MRTYDRIEGLEGREPVGAVLTIGRKGAKGNPEMTDRFWIVSPYEDEQRVRPLLPAFKAFNEHKVAEHRQQIRGNFVHATIGEAWEYSLRAQRLPSPHPNPPGMRPACTGDGINASRYGGEDEETGEDTWREITCPHDLCEFRQGDVKACKPFGRLLFRPDWDRDTLPTPLTKWVTRSWNSVRNVIGFFEHVSDQAEGLGIVPKRPEGFKFNPATPIYGLPFILQLGRKTQPGRNRAFPVVSMTPTDDLITYYLYLRKQLEAAGGMLAIPSAVTITGPEEQAAEVVDADHEAVSVPGQSALFTETA